MHRKICSGICTISLLYLAAPVLADPPLTDPSLADYGSNQAPAEDVCRTLLINSRSIPKELVRLLGPWQCEQTHLEQKEYGIDATFVAHWPKSPNVILTVTYLAPESTKIVVETSGASPLSADWYEDRKTDLVSDFFEMNWDFNEFPGPTSEYYIGQDSGSNAQFWAERDKDGAVTWMRFSSAL